jgi:hypothetical protein
MSERTRFWQWYLFDAKARWEKYVPRALRPVLRPFLWVGLLVLVYRFGWMSLQAEERLFFVTIITNPFAIISLSLVFIGNMILLPYLRFRVIENRPDLAAAVRGLSNVLGTYRSIFGPTLAYKVFIAIVSGSLLTFFMAMIMFYMNTACAN